MKDLLEWISKNSWDFAGILIILALFLAYVIEKIKE